mgnify:FL=1
MMSVLCLIVGLSMLAAPAEAKRLRNGAPNGFEAFHVAGVIGGEDGNVLLLTNAAEDTLVPITVNNSAAMSIALRNQRKRYERPLTHDLLDAMIDILGGEIVEVRIDELIGGTYTASVDVKHKRRVHTLDARASDAVALALGRQLPVYVSDDVLEATAMVEPREDVVIRL